jgi:Methyltransferase domain
MPLDSPAVELPFGLDPYEHDPGRWGASLINQAELILALLDAVRPKSVVEVGAYAGDLTRMLLLWAQRAGATVLAIDPSPQPGLEALADEHAELQLVRETSLAALPAMDPVEVVILDGDHNYYTVTEELQAVAGWVDRGAHPLVLLHDVGWPHGRRDDYFDPEQIPAPARQPTHHGGGLYPGVDGVRHGGLPYRWPAAKEGGPRNGVLTAVEDHVADQPELHLAVLPAFFGLGAVWPANAPYADALMAILQPWAGNSMLERLESNRVLHLASSHFQFTLLRDAQARLDRIEPLLQSMLTSRAFWAAELWLRLRQRGRPLFSRQAIRDALDGDR